MFEYGHSYGWININKQSQLENEIFAQLMTNNGYLVIICYYHLINKNKGHIAVIKPYEIDTYDIIKYGCMIT